SEASGRVDAVHVYATAQANGSSACDAPWPEVLAVQCSDVADRGVRCAGLPAHFGTAIATGDVDGDGRDELLVGAPHATVDQTTRAGAVYVLRGSGSGAALTLATSTVLRDAAPTVDAFLGRDVRVALIGQREEPIVAAPGITAVRVYFCTGLDGDRPNTAGLGLECR
ncbi:MAG: integrin alpha, partial [Deltaproteobacteria bacterium]